MFEVYFYILKIFKNNNKFILVFLNYFIILILKINFKK
jgi:hypothetical protein